MNPNLPSYQQPSQTARFGVALVYMSVALLTLYVHAVLSVKLGILGFVWIVGTTIAFFFIRREIALVLMVASIFLQNMFISLVAYDITTDEQWMLVQGTSFLCIIMTSIGAVPKWLMARNSLPADNRNLLYWLGLFLGMTVFYTLIGLFTASFSNVAVYARLYLSGGLLLAIGVAFGLQVTESFFVNMVRVLAVILVVWGFTEFFFTYELYSLFNISEFMRMKFHDSAFDVAFDSIRDAIEFSTRSYLNLSGSYGINLDLVRMNGPAVHPITYAYCLEFCAVICYMYRATVLCVLCTILTVLVGAKGPIIIIAMSILLANVYTVTRNRKILAIVLYSIMGLYATGGLIYGFISNDYHVVGFMGGIKGFTHNPLGHGIGMGGTLANLNEATSEKTMEGYQNNGADYGFESTIGVVIYQIGIAIAIFFLFYRRLYQALWKDVLASPETPRLVIAPSMLVLLAFTGIFQEEAFSPTGWGMWMLYNGFILGKYWLRVTASPSAAEAASQAGPLPILQKA